MTDENPPPTSVDRLLEDTLANGELERQLRVEHRRWDHLLDFDEFRNDTLSRAWEHRAQFRGTSAAEFFIWLRRIGRSVAVGVYRQRRQTAGLRARLASLLTRSFASSTVAIQTHDLVEWLLAGLTERERNVLIWKYFEGLSMDIIAARLQTTRQGAYQLHYRAIVKLRERTKKTEIDR